jgi:hypothetical protein
MDTSKAHEPPPSFILIAYTSILGRVDHVGAIQGYPRVCGGTYHLAWAEGETDVQTSIGESVTARTETLGMSYPLDTWAIQAWAKQIGPTLMNSFIPRTGSS